MKPETLSPAERLSLINQFKILSLMDEEQSMDYNYKVDILESGYTGLYFEVFQYLSEEKPKELYTETTDILRMYRIINNSIAQLSPEERNSLDLEKIEWEGFDNHQEHYHLMMLLFEHGKWDELKDKPLDSHSGLTIDKYRKMLATYKRIKENWGSVSKNQIQEIIDSV